MEASAGGHLVLHTEHGDTRVLTDARQEIHCLAAISISSRHDQFPDGLLLNWLAPSTRCGQAMVFGGKFGAVEIQPITSARDSAQPSTRELLERFPLQRFHGVDIRTVAVTPDQRSVAVAGDDRSVHILSLQTGEELLTFAELPTAVNQLTFSPDGHHLAAALHSGELRIWQAPHP